MRGFSLQVFSETPRIPFPASSRSCGIMDDHEENIHVANFVLDLFSLRSYPRVMENLHSSQTHHNGEEEEGQNWLVEELSEQGTKTIQKTLAREGLELSLEEVFDSVHHTMYRLADRLTIAERCIRETGQDGTYEELLNRAGLDRLE